MKKLVFLITLPLLLQGCIAMSMVSFMEYIEERNCPLDEAVYDKKRSKMTLRCK